MGMCGALMKMEKSTIFFIYFYFFLFNLTQGHGVRGGTGGKSNVISNNKFEWFVIMLAKGRRRLAKKYSLS